MFNAYTIYLLKVFIKFMYTYYTVYTSKTTCINPTYLLYLYIVDTLLNCL